MCRERPPLLIIGAKSPRDSRTNAPAISAPTISGKTSHDAALRMIDDLSDGMQEGHDGEADQSHSGTGTGTGGA